MRPTAKARGVMSLRADIRRPRGAAGSEDTYGHRTRTLDPQAATVVSVDVPCNYWVRNVREFSGDERGGVNVEHVVMLPSSQDILELDMVRVFDRQGNPHTEWLEVSRVEEPGGAHQLVHCVRYGR